MAKRFLRLVPTIITCLLVIWNPTWAEEKKPHENVFFGFEFFLTPLAVKWACGADPTPDLARLYAVAQAFPEDAEEADLVAGIELMRQGSQKPGFLRDQLGQDLTSDQLDQICQAALKLDAEWMTPASMSSKEDNWSPEQRKAWEEFFQFF